MAGTRSRVWKSLQTSRKPPPSSSPGERHKVRGSVADLGERFFRQSRQRSGVRNRGGEPCPLGVLGSVDNWSLPKSTTCEIVTPDFVPLSGDCDAAVARRGPNSNTHSSSKARRNQSQTNGFPFCEKGIEFVFKLSYVSADFICDLFRSPALISTFELVGAELIGILIIRASLDDFIEKGWHRSHLSGLLRKFRVTQTMSKTSAISLLAFC